MTAPTTALDHPRTATGSSTPVVVLDTNVVLDWLLFEDGSCAGLARRLHSGQVRWHATESMRNELAGVLRRRQLQHWSPNREHILSTFELLAVVQPMPLCAAESIPKLRCRDPDDQKFIDLAVAVEAKWLFSKDRALLDLARAARAIGIEVLTPAQWQRTTMTPHGET